MEKKILYKIKLDQFYKLLEKSFDSSHDDKFRKVIKLCFNETLSSFVIFEVVKMVFLTCDLKVKESGNLNLGSFFSAKDYFTDKAKFEHKMKFELTSDEVNVFIEYECDNAFMLGKINELIEAYVEGIEKAAPMPETIKEALKDSMGNYYKIYTHLKTVSETLQDKNEEEKFDYFINEFLFNITLTNYVDVKDNILKKGGYIEDNKG